MGRKGSPLRVTSRLALSTATELASPVCLTATLDTLMLQLTTLTPQLMSSDALDVSSEHTIVSMPTPKNEWVAIGATTFIPTPSIETVERSTTTVDVIMFEDAVLTMPTVPRIYDAYEVGTDVAEDDDVGVESSEVFLTATTVTAMAVIVKLRVESATDIRTNIDGLELVIVESSTIIAIVIRQSVTSNVESFNATACAKGTAKE